MLHQSKKALLLSAIEPYDGGEILHLLRREVVDLASDLAVDVPRVDHQHFVFTRGRLGTVKVPQLAGNGTGIEKVLADGDHHIHITGFDDQLAYVFFTMPGTRRLRGHDKTSAALFAQVAPEIGDPEVIPVADFIGFVHPWQAKGETWIAFDPLGIDQIDIERRIGHHEVAFAIERVLILVIRDGVGDFAFETMNGQIHFGDANGIGVFLLSVEDDLLRRVAALMLDEVTGLHEHSA